MSSVKTKSSGCNVKKFLSGILFFFYTEMKTMKNVVVCMALTYQNMRPIRLSRLVSKLSDIGLTVL